MNIKGTNYISYRNESKHVQAYIRSFQKVSDKFDPKIMKSQTLLWYMC